MERINPPSIITPYNRVNEEYKLLRVLGEGGFGKCYEAKKGNGQIFAIKVLSKLKLRGKESTKERILDACNYMHQNMMIHRDLKLANLFLSADMRVKIGDFGLTAKLNLMDYMAPEIIGRIGHSFEVDLWSIGVIMGGHFGFPTSVNNHVSKEAKALIQSILNRNPNQRPTINEIFNHDFFKIGFTPQQIPTSALTVAPNFDNFYSNNETTEISDNINSRSQISLSTVRSSGSSELNEPNGLNGTNGSKSVKTISQMQQSHRTRGYRIKRRKIMSKLSPKAVSLALLLLAPSCFLATAAIQQLQIVEESLLPFLRHFKAKDIPFLMAGIIFVWTYVITASLSVIAQSIGSRSGGYDNREPRLYKSSLRGTLTRMVAAHEVALENAPAFFAAVIIASANKVPLKYRTSFSVVYTVLRIIHTPLYVLDFDIARAIAHIMALSCTTWLFAFALLPGFEQYYSSIIEVVNILRSVSDDAWTFD
ncbi:1077_t:CDS:10 [Diversispora eburnea]|uniref:1077_t:CDS:1 n=1 Tax=Diversispora eburnea TaxID=1213867 RepID=A0A9N8ZXV2_9GLOM|nr:1077_t:CDS:10 [Diversispora eburnea]